jgi:endonuclease/exonuclease/phosphatase family metal-dependent hydrolase
VGGARLRTGAAFMSVCALGGVVACTPDPDPPASGDLSVLSYNVAGLPQEISTVNPQEHIPLISPLLNDYDLVMTQEDFDWWTPLLDSLDFVHYHERLRAEATHEYRSARHPGPEAVGLDPATRPELNVGDGLGFLSRSPFTGETRVPWAGCFGGFDTNDGGAADCLAMKGFAVVELTLADGVTVHAYTLHAEAGSTPQDQRLQVDDFEQLADYIEAHSAGRPIILAGDTNLHTDPGSVDATIWQGFLDRTGLVDACTAAIGCTQPSAIDKLATRSADGVTLTPTSHAFPRERFRDAEGVDLSDHPPLVVDIAWTTAED